MDPLRFTLRCWRKPWFIRQLTERGATVAENGYRGQSRSHRQKRGQHVMKMQDQIAHHAQKCAEKEGAGGNSGASPSLESPASTENDHAAERGQAGAQLDLAHQAIGAGQRRSAE